MTAHFEIIDTLYVLHIVNEDGVTQSQDIRAKDFTQSLDQVVSHAIKHNHITQARDIDTVGIRVVAPGSYFAEHRLIDRAYYKQLRQCRPIAPLHIPAVVDEIDLCRKLIKDIKIWGISDSAFHVTIPDFASAVSIPRADAIRYDIKRFGYHGLSCASIMQQVGNQFATVPPRVIICHVGGGISVTAVQNGSSIATSMGYSPASGIIMGSRGGDVTADVAITLAIKAGMSLKKLYHYIYEQSGFQGVAGVRDLRILLDQSVSGDYDSRLAVDMLVYQLQSWIASHTVLMGGVDVVVMTGTASVRNPMVRSLLLRDMASIGITIDSERNTALVDSNGVISSDGSIVRVIVMDTAEIAQMEQIVHELQ